MREKRQGRGTFTLLGMQSRFGNRPAKFQVVCPQSGTAVVKGVYRPVAALYEYSNNPHLVNVLFFTDVRVSVLLTDVFVFFAFVRRCFLRMLFPRVFFSTPLFHV